MKFGGEALFQWSFADTFSTGAGHSFPDVALLVLGTSAPLLFSPHELSSRARNQGCEGAGGAKTIDKTETKLHNSHVCYDQDFKTVPRLQQYVLFPAP